MKIQSKCNTPKAFEPITLEIVLEDERDLVVALVAFFEAKELFVANMQKHYGKNINYQPVNFIEAAKLLEDIYKDLKDYHK